MDVRHGRYGRMYKTLGAVSAVALLFMLGGEIDSRLRDERSELFEIPAAPDVRAEVGAPNVRPLDADYPTIDVPELRPALLRSARIVIPARPLVDVLPEAPDLSVLVDELPLIDVPDLRPPGPKG